MQLLYRNGPIEIWAVNETWGTDYYVYGVYASGDPRICSAANHCGSQICCAIAAELRFCSAVFEGMH